jgi:predicted transcriptional regulator
VKIAELSGATVREVMQTRIIGVEADTTVRDFRASIAARHHHTIYPVYDHAKVIGTIATGVLPRTDPARWDTIKVGELTARDTSRVAADCDLAEALRLLVREGADQMLLVTDENESLLGIVTKTDILRSLRNDNPRAPNAVAAAS